MGGQLKVESKPGVGSDFRVVIPCPQRRDTPDETPSLSGTVLWVDDDQDILSLYKVILENWGLRVITANSVAQARDLFDKHDCPVVVTDMHLTDGNGVELFSHLRTERPGVSGIIISGSGLVDLAPDIAAKGIRTLIYLTR